MRRVSIVIIAGASLLMLAYAATAQRRDVYVASRDHAAIRYSTAPVANAISELNARIAAGSETWTFNETSGYLTSVLGALDVPVESQALVFSPTSLQSSLINIRNPRAVYFNDRVSVGWVRGGSILEAAVLDPKQGVVFYALEQKPAATPQFTRDNQCLACHLSWETLGVPGLLLTSMHPLPDDPHAYANGYTTVQGSPLEQRWGGWFVTGDHGGAAHLGNIPVMPPDA
jgi:hypothetical protein